MLEAPTTTVTCHVAASTSPTTAYPGRRYSIYPPNKDERLSRPELTQVNELPQVATEVPVIPGVSWLSRPSAPLRTAGVNNLPTVVTHWPASAGFKPVSFKQESKALCTQPPTPGTILHVYYTISRSNRTTNLGQSWCLCQSGRRADSVATSTY